jgi:hypothetical protein
MPDVIAFVCFKLLDGVAQARGVALNVWMRIALERRQRSFQ